MRSVGIRQQPGLACEECRRRKARCDRVRPQCGSCTATGTACVTVDKRPQRGPKKGELKAMRLRIGETSTLDHGSHANTNAVSDDYITQITGLDDMGLTESLELACVTSSTLPSLATSATSAASTTSTSSDALGLPNWTEWQDLDSNMMEPLELAGPGPNPILRDFNMSHLMRADLDQLYFDRVHPVAPMINQRRYFAWVSEDNPPLARVCLRSAMRTTAAAVSAQYRSLSDALYAETCRLLETLGQTQATEAHWVKSNDKIPLEQIQAWLLVVHYEFLCKDEHQAMLTAGRAFRLVQMARLYDVDMPDSSSGESFAEAEERRRTFWLAFSFDRFLCSRNEWPLTLQEEMIYTRLPAPEENFQNSQPVQVDFLLQAMAASGPNTSPFAECIILATLHGRCMAHRRASLASPPAQSGTEAREFWVRHELLASAVEKRVQLLVQTSPAATAMTVDRDPMLLFAHMMAHSAVLYLSSTVERTPWQTAEHQLMTISYERRASLAASEMVRLAKLVPSLSLFNVHPFLPKPLAYATTFLITHAKSPDVENLHERGRDGVEHLVRVLRNLGNVNNLARKLLYSLETDCNNYVFGQYREDDRLLDTRGIKSYYIAHS